MKIRNTLPEYGNPFYNTTGAGGYSYCIVGSPVCDGRNVLANCVGYACGRFNEIIGSMKYPYFNCNAENFIYRARTYYPELKITDYPTVGGIMVFHKKGADYGHVFIVENIIDDNTIYTSESAYQGSAFFNATRYKGSNWSMGDSYEFLGCINNPSVNPEPTPTPSGEGYYKVVNGPLLLLNDGYASIGCYPDGTVVQYIRDGYTLRDGSNVYHYYYVRVTTDGKEGYMAREYLTPCDNPNPQPQPEPTPSKDIKKGTRVKCIGMGKASSNGDLPNAMSGLEGYIGYEPMLDKPYPYCVFDDEGPLGWYKEQDLEII